MDSSSRFWNTEVQLPRLFTTHTLFITLFFLFCCTLQVHFADLSHHPTKSTTFVPTANADRFLRRRHQLQEWACSFYMRIVTPWLLVDSNWQFSYLTSQPSVFYAVGSESRLSCRLHSLTSPKFHHWTNFPFACDSFLQLVSTHAFGLFWSGTCLAPPTFARTTNGKWRFDFQPWNPIGPDVSMWNCLWSNLFIVNTVFMPANVTLL